jgi:WD40 repeat protein
MTAIPFLAFLLLSSAAQEEDPFAPELDRPSIRVPEVVEPLASPVAQQEAAPLDPASPPILRLNPRGSQARSAAVAFSPDGRTLYAAGGDKVVHVWHLGQTADDAYHDRPPRFLPVPERTLRIPVGPGLWGTINALAVSADGKWLVVGGWGWAEGRGVAGFRDTGLIWPDSAFFPETLGDIGTLFLFDLTTGRATHLRGHLGPVVALAFADGTEPAVISIGIEQPPGGAVKGVVRAWDVATGKERGRTVLPKEPGERYAPSLVAWKLPDGGTRAAFTWADGWVRLWDVGQRPAGFDATLSMVCLRRPGSDELFYGEFAAGENRLTRRLILPDRRHWRASAEPIRFDAQSAPVAAAFVSSRVQRPADYLAIAVAEATSAGPIYRLELRRTDDGRRVANPIPLAFTGTPALAASSTGKLVASSEPDGALLLFDVSRWLAGEVQPERLRGQGESVRRASWVHRDEKIGIHFRDGDRQWLLDLSVGEVVSDAAGWSPGHADAGGWAIRREPLATQTRLRLVGPNRENVTAVVPDRCEAATLCAAVPGVGRPILAAAATGNEDAGWLYLYDAIKGEKIRKLSGHTAGVTSLAFSPDGRLLLSAARDRTVNVWWLGDLPELIGEQGLLRGLKLAAVEGGLEVKEFSEEASNDLRLLLPVGRVIHGMIRPDGTLETLIQPGAFYRRISEQQPGTDLRLRTDRGDVTVRVEQAIDERKPLFSLFFDYDAATDRRSWIGWSPFGPFESSDRLIEKLVGWHFNPRRPEEPVRFADLGEYREAFFGRGLLEALIRTGRIPAEWPPAQPRLSLLFRDVNGQPQLPDEAGRLAADAIPSELIVEVSGVPADRVGQLRWQINEGESRPLQPSPTDRGIWTADLRNAMLDPGDHEITVLLTGPGFEPAQSEVLLSLQQPAPPPPPPELPRIAIRSPVSGTVLYDERPDESAPTVPIAVHVTRWSGSEPLAAEFLLNGRPVERDGIPLRVSIEPSEEPQTISTEIELLPGRNRIGVRLVESSDTTGSEQAVTVRYLRPPVVLAVEAPREVEGETVTLQATVRSVTELLRDEVRIVVNGVPVSSPFVVVEQAGKEHVWKVRVEKIPLGRVQNEIRIEVANVDGVSRQPARALVTRVTPAPKPVRVELAGIPSTVPAREQVVDARVQTIGPLVRAELYVNDRVTSLEIGDADAGGEYHFRQAVSLDRSINNLRLVATAADGGVGQATATISVIERPVTVEIDQLVAADGQVSLVRSQADGSLGLEGAVPTDTAALYGRIVWTTEADRPRDRPIYLQAWVNGFLQASRRIEVHHDGRELSFEIPVALNRQTGNRVRLELPAFAEEEGVRRHLVLDCARPNTRQRIHVLLAGVGLPTQDREAFTRAIVESLGASEGGPSSEGLVVYPPLVGDVYSGDILAHLQLFRHRPPEPGWAHDVLLFYFQGEEAAKERGHFVLVTSDNAAAPTKDESAITSQRLSDLLQATPGAHLLFLDVTRYRKETGQRPAYWPRDTHLGILRSVWLGSGPIPAELSLIEDLREASRVDRRLGKIAESIERMRTGRDTLYFDPHVPADLTELVLIGGEVR